jgi:AraC-like DNA-binding protein
MTVFTQLPSAALRPWVKQLLVVEFSAAHQDAHLPEPGLIAAFPFRGTCRLADGRVVSRAALTGLSERLRHHAHSPDNAVVIAGFTPLGAAAFIRHPLDEVANTTVDLVDLWGDSPAIAELSEQLAEAPHHARRIHLVESFFLARLHRATPDPLVSAAVAWLENAPPSARIEQLVRHIGLSQSALERRFRRVVGASPRRFASLLRLQQVDRLRASGATFTAIAHAAGYFDQSHFIHDFKRVTGLAPETYFAHAPGG